MKKIIIVGTSGCGKTTLAHKLSILLNIPAYDLDDYYWLPQWTINTHFPKTVVELINQETWIISGNYSKEQEKMWKKADCVIWLDYSFLRCLYQGIKRSIKRILTHEKCCNGNEESLRRLFSRKNSIIFWIIQTYEKRKSRYTQVFEKSHLIPNKYLRFKNPKETQQWLNHL